MNHSESNDPTLSVIQSDLLMNLVAVFLLLIGSQATSKVSVGAGRSGREDGRDINLSLYLSDARVHVGSPESRSLSHEEFDGWLSQYSATNSKPSSVILIHHTDNESAGAVFSVLSKVQAKLPQSTTQLTMTPE